LFFVEEGLVPRVAARWEIRAKGVGAPSLAGHFPRGWTPAVDDLDGPCSIVLADGWRRWRVTARRLRPALGSLLERAAHGTRGWWRGGQGAREDGVREVGVRGGVDGDDGALPRKKEDDGEGNGEHGGGGGAVIVLVTGAEPGDEGEEKSCHCYMHGDRREEEVPTKAEDSKRGARKKLERGRERGTDRHEVIETRGDVVWRESEWAGGRTFILPGVETW
jgi:hypothetical protein